MDDASLKQALFVGAKLTACRLRSTNLYQAQFQQSVCLNTSFVGADLTYADFSRADVSDSNFSDATLFRTRFHRTIEKNTRFSHRTLALGNDEGLAKAETWKPRSRP